MDDSPFHSDPPVLEIAERYSRDWGGRIRVYRRLGVMSLLAATLPSALIPVCIVAAPHWSLFYFGELFPSLLAATALAGSALTFYVRPFERLRISRQNLMILRSERRRFVHGLPPYDDSVNAEALFLQSLDDIRQVQYEQWVQVLPASHDVASRHL